MGSHEGTGARRVALARLEGGAEAYSKGIACRIVPQRRDRDSCASRRRECGDRREHYRAERRTAQDVIPFDMV